MALEERFARRLRESCDDAVAAARRFEVRSVAVHQYVRDEVTGEAQPLVAFTGSGSATARQPGFLERGAGRWVALRTQEVVLPTLLLVRNSPYPGARCRGGPPVLLGRGRALPARAAH